MPSSVPANDLVPAGESLLLALMRGEQSPLTAVDRFAHSLKRDGQPARATHYRDLLPARPPQAGQQYAFEVNLDRCSGCKSCVTACHSLNGLEEGETWRAVGLLVSEATSPAWESSADGSAPSFPRPAFLQHVTTACHHCVDPGCLNGCPVLAYDKDRFTGIVRHLDDQCMGCSYCIMKCPYEVPRYSGRLGIVRKCDMCANRLAVGEAPACVQACPHEAIRITLVETASVLHTYRGADAAGGAAETGTAGSPALSASPTGCFLPDSPCPALTLPTTRYVSARGLPTSLIAADHAALRLDNPHWPLVLLLVLTQAGAGLFTASAVLHMFTNTVALAAAGLALLVGGLAAATWHLGRPLKAWRAFLGWRKSWLSRELIAFNAFGGAATLALLLSVIPDGTAIERGATVGLMPLAGEVNGLAMSLAALAGLLAVFTSAMVYVDTGRPFWCARRTFGLFFGTTLLLGASLAAVILGWSGAPVRLTRAAAIAALLLTTLLFLWRCLEMRRALNNVASPIHFNARIVRERLPHTSNLRAALFVASAGFGFLAILNVADLAPVWAGAAALATLSSELVGRYVFFAAGAAKRMPGGIAP